MKYDYLIVGSGLYGATFAHLAAKAGKKCFVIDKRPHLGGNIYCEDVDGIHVHKYGAHILQPDEAWTKYVQNKLADIRERNQSDGEAGLNT